MYSQLVALNDQVCYSAFHFNFFEQNPQLLERYRIPEAGNPKEWERFLAESLSEKEENIKAEGLSKEASRALTDFRKKRIYLPADTADKVERLMSLFLYIGSQFRSVNYRDLHDLKPVVVDEVINVCKRALTAEQELFPQLEAQFREHLVGKDV